MGLFPFNKVTKTQMIKFRGKTYVLIGSNTNGAIATKRAYENFETSYAHLMKDGRILRFGKQIGGIDDITFTGKKYKP